MTDDNSMMRPKKLDVALLGIIITMLLQGAGGVWFAATLNARVQTLENEAVPLKAVVETVARLDERTKAMGESTQRIERRLETRDPR